MKAVIFSDVHGNLYALQELFGIEPDADQYVCLGDVVGYGPQSDECLDFITDNDVVCIVGNHEEMFYQGAPHEGCSDIAKLFHRYSIRSYSKNRYDDMLKSFPETYELGAFTCIHTLLRRHIYPDTDLVSLGLTGNYFIGHSHYQFDRTEGDLRVINVGSLGQNRKNIETAHYAVYDSETGEVELKGFESKSIPRLIDDMRKLGYEAELIEYYSNKLSHA